MYLCMCVYAIHTYIYIYTLTYQSRLSHCVHIIQIHSLFC